MPIDYQLYPVNWQEIRAEVLQRAGQRCEWCGAANHERHPLTGSRVVLTIAHLDHDIANNQPANLAALCQRCHLRHDAGQHKLNAALTRRAKHESRGQLTLWPNTQST